MAAAKAKAPATIAEDTLHVTDGTHTAAEIGERWHSENATFALWLNTAFLRAGRSDAALAADLEAHGMACEYGATADRAI